VPTNIAVPICEPAVYGGSMTFHHNFPPTLVPGRAVRPDRREPIALLEVKRGADGQLIAYGEDIVRPTGRMGSQ
jgi:hypothetical protein